MIATTEIPVWTRDAAVLARQFFLTTAGQALLANLALSRPSLHPGSPDLNLRAISAAEVSGFERCFNALLNLSVPEEEKSPEDDNYPPLDDESAWATKPPTTKN